MPLSISFTLTAYIIAFQSRRQGSFQSCSQITHQLFGIKRLTAAKHLYQLGRKCSGIKIAQEMLVFLISREVFELFDIIDHVHHDAVKVIAKKSFELISDDRIIGAVQYRLVFLNIFQNEQYLDKKTHDKLISENYSRLVIQLDTAYEGDETFSLVEKIRSTAQDFYDEYYLAGNGVSTYDLMDTVTSDMMKVNLIAIGAVFVVLLLSMKSVTLPFILVLSIETAIWLNLSFPYFTDKPIFYIAYLIISSIQLGATVDYLNSGMKTLKTGAGDLDSGAGALSAGAKTLKTGSSALKDGTEQLVSGAQSLDNGIDKLQSGVTMIQGGLDTLGEKSDSLKGGSAKVLTSLETINASLGSVSADTAQLEQLVTASGQIMEGITSLKTAAETLESNVGYEQYKAVMGGNGLDIDALTAGNTQVIETLSTQITELNTTLDTIKDIPGCEEQAAQLTAQIEQLSQIVTLMQGNNAAIGGTEAYLTQVSEYITELKNGIAALETQYTQFHAAINTLANQLSGMLIKLNTLSAGINTLVTEYQKLDTGINDYTDGVAQIVVGYSQLTDGVQGLSAGSKTLVSGAEIVNSGANSLYSGIVSLSDGADTLSDGTKNLYKGASTLADGSAELSGGMQELFDGTTELSNGTTELYDKTADMDTQVSEKLDSVLDSLKGSNEVISFVSEKNTDVEAVQFVIKTQAIEIPQEEVPQEQTEVALSFLQKLLRLFGLY